MVAFFPTPYPDGELLYSVLARYHVRSGNISPKATIEELFGSRSVTSVVDLPANIDSLINNLPIGSAHTAEKLIYENTLYPFYSAFLPPERAEIVMKSMKGNDGGKIHNRMGIMASSITVNKYLRWCSECAKESETTYGELYWKRSHQVPGVVICSKHRTLLNDSTVQLKHFNRHEYIPASLDCCVANSESKVFSTFERLVSAGFEHKYYQLIENVDKLLNNQYPKQSPQWFFSKYINRLKEMGLANVSGRVNQQELKKAFIAYYGESFLELVQSPVTDSDSTWLSMMVRKPRKSFHPIRHLLMIQFLGVTLESFWNEENEYLPFGKAPFPCLNAGAEHYLKPVITKISIRYDSKVKRPVGTFSCSCGFIYARKGPDNSGKDKFKVGRVKQFGGVWEAKLEELLQMDLSPREIARRLKVDVNTVIKYGQKTSEEVLRYKSNVSQYINESYRKEWLDLQKENPQKRKTELRKMNNRLYTWLYRNDREWLNSNSPIRRQVSNANNRVNWNKRDEEILEAVKDVIDTIMQSTEKPERITIGLVGKKIGKLSLLEKHLNKLPLTNAYLNSEVETVKDFQKRRIKWAIERSDEPDLSWWKVAKRAGIREEDWKEFEKYYLWVIENEERFIKNRS